MSQPLSISGCYQAVKSDVGNKIRDFLAGQICCHHSRHTQKISSHDLRSMFCQCGVEKPVLDAFLHVSEANVAELFCPTV